MNISKLDAVAILENMKDGQNDIKIEQYISRIIQMSEEVWQEFVIKNGILSVEKFKEEADKRINKKEQPFISLNDLVSFGREDTTLHIHLVPKDAHSLLSRQGFIYAETQLIDALYKIKEMLKSNEEFNTIRQVYAVSGLIHGPVKRMFTNLGFDVKSMKRDEAKEDEELANFYEMFKDNLKIGSAKLSKEQLLSREWDKLASDRKSELAKKTSAKSLAKTEEEQDRG